MRLLIVTQAVDLDDPILGFFHRWIEEFAKHTEHIEIICLREGRHHLPGNVKVHSLGKEKRKAFSLAYIFRFLALIWKLRRSYDTVFVHMNPEYVLLGGALWRLLGKRIGLWYTHGTVSWRLRAAVRLAHNVFTASEESMRIPTRKKRVVGHGIDTALFSTQPHALHAELRLVTVGRISATKRVKEMLLALDVLHKEYKSFIFSIVGAPVTSHDYEYARELSAEISRRPYAEKVLMKGPLSQERLATFLKEQDIFLHLSSTQSLDKAVLEAALAGLRIVTSSSVYAGILAPIEHVPDASGETVAHAIAHTALGPGASLKEGHRLETLIPTLLRAYEPGL